MSAQATERAARLLQDARTHHRLLEHLPEDCRPRTLAEAYAIQDRLVSLLGEDIGGWFLGATNPAIQDVLGLAEPYAARLLASAIRESPAVLDVPPPLEVVLEVEFAFRLRHDLPPRERAYTEEEVAEAVGAVHPAIEVVIAHFEDWTRQDVYSLIADNGTDGALVHGAGVERWRALDLPAMAVRLLADGELVREGRGSDIGAGPIATLTWLANHHSRAGRGLSAGHLHNTGSCTMMYDATRGSHAVAEFDGLGEVRVELRG